MSILPPKVSLSDEEDNLGEDEPVLYSTDIRKNLMEDFTSKTPMKLTRESINHKREHMKVFLRIRPFTDQEVRAGEEQDCMHVSKDTTLTMRAPKNSFAFKSSMRGCQDMTHNFTFTGIYGQDTSQKNFFDDTMLSSVKSVIDGQNSLVFTYGVTNAGKTYTIQGMPQDGGILPRTLDVIFNSIDGRHYDSMKLKPRYFCDVVKLTNNQVQAEAAIKSSVLSMASSSSQQEIEPDSLEASDIEASRLSNNSTVYEDSLMSDASTSSLQGTHDSTKDCDVTQSLINDIRSRIPDDTSIDVEAQGPVKFSIWVSFAEIYNEYIYDLLEAMPRTKKVRRQALKLSEDKNGSIFVKGLKEIQVSGADEAYKVLKIGQKNLSIAATKLNHNSSRSHCIFSIKILRVVDVQDPHVARVSKISFCDLAGSERSTKTQSAGDRLKEAGNINTSLLTLGKCIHALRYNQNHTNAHAKVIPFRESKLTRLFQSFFLGKGIASMIVNVNQCASLFDETMHVLKFSAIAKQVTTVTSKLDNKWQLPKPKNKLISARALSLAVDKSLNSNNARASIPWATPKTMAREVQRASDLTRIDESIVDEEDEEEEEELDETIFDDGTPQDKEGVAGASRTVLVNLVNVLKNELIEAKQQIRTIESQIRAEVCEEMAKQLVEIEASYNERLQEEKEIAEEVLEKRMEILTKSVKKTHSKRPRIQEDPEEYVPAMVHTALEAKMEEKEEKIAELTKELNDSYTYLQKFKTEKEKDENEKIEQLTKELNESHANLKKFKSEKETESEEKIAALSKELDESRADLEKFKMEMANGKDERIAELTKELDESHANLKKFQMEIAKGTNQRNEMEATASDESQKYRDQIKVGQQKLHKLESEKQALEEELKASKELLKTFQERSDHQRSEVTHQYQELEKTSNAKVQELSTEMDNLASSHQVLVQQLEEMKENADSSQQELIEQVKTLSKEKEKLKNFISDLEEQLATVASSASEDKLSLESKIQDTIQERDQLVAMLDDQKSQVQTLQEESRQDKETSDVKFQDAINERNRLVSSLEVLEKQMTSLKDEHNKESQNLEGKIESQAEEMRTLKSQLEKETGNIEEMKSHSSEEVENMKQKCSKLERENQELQKEKTAMDETLREVKNNKVTNLQEAKAEFEKQRKELEAQLTEANEKISNSDRKDDELKDQVEQLTQENKYLMSQIENQESSEKEKSSQHFEELEVYKNRVASLVVENENLLTQKTDVENEAEELRKQIEEGREECEKIIEENKELSKKLKDVEQKTIDLTTQAIEMTSTKLQETEQSTKLRLENRKLNAKVPVLEKQLDELMDEMPPLRKRNVSLMKENQELKETLKRENSMRDDLFKQKADTAEEFADLKQRAELADEKKEAAEAKVMSLLKEMDALKEELAKKDVVHEKVTVEEVKKQEIRKEEIKKEEVKEQIKESEGEMTDKMGDEEDEDDDDEDEECAVYTLDDLEDGLEEEEEENVVEETEQEEEVKNSSRISFAEPASTDTSRVEVDATPLMKRKKQKATKSRKRKSADLLEDDDDHKKKKKFKEVVAPRRQTRGMSRAKRAKTVPVRFEEQENIPEEGTSPGAISTTSTDSSVRRGALSKLGGMLQNSPLGRSAKKLVGSTTTSPAPKPPSPPKVVQVQAEGKRRKRKLFKTDISAPFECSPFETVSIGDAKTVVDSNQRVTRSLRSRIKKNTNN
ncbi:uncharacterized protein [Apostichopus japonicus]|uniref:uncharacterized protein isoform X2 n=1 Tax=Stichopus japonicus TaxID=307972 RepID=UPI003AB4BBEF